MCYQVEVYKAIFLTFYLQTYFKQTHFFLQNNMHMGEITICFLLYI